MASVLASKGVTGMQSGTLTGSVVSGASETGASHSAGAILVTIADTGPGIAPGDRERIFESFFTTKTGGVGIGLSICRSIIDAHGGRLWVDAHHPSGAAFAFTLPVTQ